MNEPSVPRRLAFFISSILAAEAQASDGPAGPPVLEEIIVTAQKRYENLQIVPISVQVLDTKKLEELHITSDGPRRVSFGPTPHWSSAITTMSTPVAAEPRSRWISTIPGR